jgi:hypothetical protein
MPELHPNGNYEAYLAQLFNPISGGTQFNPGVLGSIGSSGIGTVPTMNTLLQNPWTTQNPQQLSGLWPVQQQNPLQSLPAIQLAQHIAAKQAMQAAQYAQALQALQQLAQATAQQAQFGQGIGGIYGYTPQLYGWGTQSPINQALQQQALQQQMLQQQMLQQLAQYLASQQQPQYRYGLAV